MTGNIVPELLGPAWSPDGDGDGDDDDVILRNGLCWDNFMIKHSSSPPNATGSRQTLTSYGGSNQFPQNLLF